MKILVSVAVWGRSYAKTFSDDSLASQLSPNNLPRLAADHRVSYHIVTTRKDAKWLLRQLNIRALGRLATIVWDLIEDYDYYPLLIPTNFDNDKYPFLSQLQNIAIARSLDYDILVFNYADFIWADGALCNAVALMDDGVEAVLSFCLPVDRDDGKRALAPFRTTNEDAHLLIVPSRAAAGIAIDHMHREARLRVWDSPEFTSMPTYLIWRVKPDGLLIRAYHQTVLAVRVNADDPAYRAGIPRGSLDGYFTDLLARRGGVRHAVDSDTVAVFSLYHSPGNSAIRRGEQREDHVRQCLRTSVSSEQRRFAEVPFHVKRRFTAEPTWKRIAQESWDILSKLQDTTPFDREAFENTHAARSDLETLDRHWRKPTGNAEHVRIWLYRKVVVQLISGPAGRIVRRLLGPERTRIVWRRLNTWFFGDRPT